VHGRKPYKHKKNMRNHLGRIGKKLMESSLTQEEGFFAFSH